MSVSNIKPQAAWVLMIDLYPRAGACLSGFSRGRRSRGPPQESRLFHDRPADPISGTMVVVGVDLVVAGVITFGPGHGDDLLRPSARLRQTGSR